MPIQKMISFVKNVEIPAICASDTWQTPIRGFFFLDRDACSIKDTSTERVFCWVQVEKEKTKRQLTQASDEVVDDTPKECLPPKFNIQKTPDSDRGSNNENSSRDPLYVLEKVVEGDWRKFLLVLDCPGHIVVWKVEICWSLILNCATFNGSCCLVHWRGLRRGQGSWRGLAGLYDRRHVARETEVGGEGGGERRGEIFGGGRKRVL